MVRGAVQIPLSTRRLIFVTGKGGVGKSTLAQALGRVAAARGQRTIVVELAAGDDFVATSAGPGGDGERRLAANLYTIAIDPQRVMEEYLHLKLPAPLAGWLARSRLFGALSWATPGLRELLAIGKVWELAQPERTVADGEPFDLVIVDAPASGHGLGILRAPRTFAQIAIVGPVAATAERIDSMLHDPELTAILAVTTPEEIPVNETVELERALAGAGLRLAGVIVNARLPARFTAADAAELTTALDAVAADNRAAVACAASEHSRALRQELQVQRLGESLLQRSRSLPLIAGERGGEQLAATLATILAEYCE